MLPTCHRLDRRDARKQTGGYAVISSVSTGSPQQTDDPAMPGNPLSVVAISSDTEMQRRIAEALAGQEMPAVIQIFNSSGLGKLVEDATVVIVFVCDIDAPREIASLRRLRREAPEPAIVAISSPSTGPGVRRALDAGADGLVFDTELELTLAATVRAVAIGQSAVPRKLRAGVERPVLSHRESQVLALVRSGLTNAEIAKRLFLAESTIKSHVASIFTKFGVRSRKEVVAALDDLERTLTISPVAAGDITARRATA